MKSFKDSVFLRLKGQCVGIVYVMNPCNHE